MTAPREAGLLRADEFGQWMEDYNHHRIRQALDYATPWSLYRPNSGLADAA
jgi:transposase InsO family protein